MGLLDFNMNFTFNLLEAIEIFQNFQQRLAEIERKVDQILMTQTEMKAVLDNIDTQTNNAAASLAAFIPLGDDIKADIAKLKELLAAGGTVSPEVAALAQSISTKGATLATGLGQFKTFLEGVAQDGNPVVPNPPPPPPPVL